MRLSKQWLFFFENVFSRFHHWLVTADCTDRNLNQEDALTLHFSVAASSEHCYAVQLLSEMYKDHQPLIAFSPAFTVGNKSNKCFQLEQQLWELDLKSSSIHL